jgi:hypothetical protein
LGLLQYAVEAGEVGQGGEVGLERRLCSQVAFGEVLALKQEEDGEGEEFSQGGLLVLLFLGEADSLGLQDFELVIYPDIGSDQEGFCLKIVEGVLAVWMHSTPSFFTSRGSRSSSTRRHFFT